jgi:hypothetical protein
VLKDFLQHLSVPVYRFAQQDGWNFVLFFSEIWRFFASRQRKGLKGRRLPFHPQRLERLFAGFEDRNLKIGLSCRYEVWTGACPVDTKFGQARLHVAKKFATIALTQASMTEKKADLGLTTFQKRKIQASLWLDLL